MSVLDDDNAMRSACWFVMACEYARGHRTLYNPWCTSDLVVMLTKAGFDRDGMGELYTSQTSRMPDASRYLRIAETAEPPIREYLLARYACFHL